MGQSNKSGQRNPNNPPSPNKGRSMAPVNHSLKYTEEDLLKTAEFAKRNARGNLIKELGLTELNSGIGSTPSSNWFAKGEQDDFPDLVNQDRASLCLGRLNDDEMANLVFMQGDISKEDDMRLMLAHMEAGKDYYSKMAAVMGGKERIRWLSRHLEMSLLRERTQRTTIWNYIIDTYGECGGEASILEACEKLGLSKEYAMKRMHPDYVEPSEERREPDINQKVWNFLVGEYGYGDLKVLREKADQMLPDKYVSAKLHAYVTSQGQKRIKEEANGKST